jgi:hypothetical protein
MPGLEKDELTLLVDQLRWDRRRDPYAGGHAYSRAANGVADECATLIAAGQATLAVPVLRKAVDRMTTALQYVDSSSGVLGNDLAYLMELYARACAAAPPNPTTLAAWLVKIVCDGPGWPDVLLREWSPALGEKGLARLATLVEQRQAAADPDDRYQQWPVRYLREQLAEVSGDVDRYVAVLAERLESADQYRRIVQVLADAGRDAEAISWARRGLAGKGGGLLGDPLRDLLVRLLISTGDPQAAVAERRTEFEQRPTADSYRALQSTVTQTDAGGDHLEWALQQLRDRSAQQPGYLPQLIDVLILTRRDDEAWQTGLARFDELHQRQRVELLEIRQATHPAEVQGPYRDLIGVRLLDSYDKRRYDNAIRLLRKLRHTYRATGDIKAFDAYLAQLRVEHRRRPNFLAKLDAARL